MFYSNAMGNEAKGARKIIHGGSGISGNGDAYGPQSNYFPLFSWNPCLPVDTAAAVFLEFHHVRLDIRIANSSILIQF